MGVTDKQANFICARSDWTGLTKCANQTLSDKVFASIERSKINGNFTLNDNAKLSVLGLADVTGNVALQGQSQYRLAHNATQTGTLVLNNQTVATVENATLAGDATLSDQAKLNFVNARFDHQIQGSKDTLVSLSDNANWTLPSSTTIGNLTLNNSQITLNPDFATQTNNQTFNQLTVLGDLSGNGTFNYRTYLQENKGDHVAVHGLATGNFVLNVRNTGAEPQTLQQLSLLTLKNTAQTDNVNVALANGTVDVGTYRYELKNDNHDYRLYNPRKEQELVDQARLAEEKRKADEAARLAEEKRKAEEAQIAEAKAKAEELRLAEEQQKEELRLAEEKRKAEEAARLAEEKRKEEEAARLAEEKRKAEEAARLAEEKRKAEEAIRLAEEKRKAEEAARLAEEKRKADEATRLAEEKRKAEEQARLDAQRKALEQESTVKKQKELISRHANSALSELSASVNSALLAQDELNKHLVSENNTNVWANTLYSSRHYDADEFRAYQQKARLTQVGVQHIDTNHRLGLLFSHSRASNAFDDNISSKGRLNVLSAFAKYDFENGLNLSADAGYGLSAGEIRGESQNAKIKRRIATIGMGLGYQLNLDKLAIRPHVGIHRYYISADSYTYAGVNVHSPKMSFNAYHAGVTVDYAFMPWEGVTIRPALTLNYVDASDSKIAMQVNQSQLTQRFDRYWQQEIGVTTDFASWQIATYAGKSRGKQLDKQYHIGLKVGYRW